jgi:hypothetical protein
VHPDTLAGTTPTIYAFDAPVQSTYEPYFDPPYWYQGYRHIVRWRYQVIAVGKNMGDLVVVLLRQPMFWAFCLAWPIILWNREARRRLWAALPARPGTDWPLWALATAGVAIYLPVHLEGRYLAPFLAVLLVLELESASDALEFAPRRQALVVAVLAAGFVLGLAKDQRDVWARVRHHWNYRDNLEWREGKALAATGLAPGSEIAVISWQPNVQCDWAYLAGMRITSEIASGPDEKAFWDMDPMDQNAVLLRFRQAGAVAVVTRDAPRGSATGWDQVGNMPMWMYRF